MKKLLLLSALAVSLVACATTGGVSQEEYNKVVAQAENEIKLANKAGFLWRDTEKFLKESKDAQKAADAALKAGDKEKANAEMEKAMKLAKKALKEAQLAQQQAKDQADPKIQL